MPDRTDKILLIAGLLAYLAGQTWINITGSMTKDEIAVDWIHWLMLVGAALMIPYAARLPRRGVALVAGPLMLIGIVLIIGMCVLDFVLWSFTDNDLRNEVIGVLMVTPSVWKPFIVYSGWVFTPAIALCAWIYWRVSKPGFLLVQSGAIFVGAFPIWSNPYGYAAITLGFLLCFVAEARGEADTQADPK